MNLESLDIQTVLSFYNQFLNNGIYVVYVGEFNHEITKMFTSMAESQMDRNEEEKTIRKKVYHSIVETLQNMNKHSDEIAREHNVGKGLFLIGKKDCTYYIITANRIEHDKIAPLKAAIDEVNSCTRDELKLKYKHQLKHGKLSTKGGAGLGLIDVARKTDKKLEYDFVRFNSVDDFFVLKVEVKTNGLAN